MPLLSLERILQSQGFGSRKGCRALAAGGRVSVEGREILDGERSFETSGLGFEVDGASWDYREKVYLALDKPPGYECSRKPSRHPPVLDLLPEQFAARGVQAVGRLDQDTTGLLLLSDDGAFIHAHTSPRRRVPKIYRATTARPVDEALVRALLDGVLLVDEEAPLAASACRRTGDFELEIELEQGKYHQVKRMIAAAGNHCAALRRIAIGGLALEALGLRSGTWTYLGDKELAALAEAPEREGGHD